MKFFGIQLTYVTTMKTTIFGENFLKVFKIRSNDKKIMFFDVFFNSQNYFFGSFNKKSFFATESGSRKEIIFSYVIQNLESCFENSSRSCSKLVTACLGRMRSPTCLYIHLYCAQFWSIRNSSVTNFSILIYIT